jgi:hypothetical protein
MRGPGAEIVHLDEQHADAAAGGVLARLCAVDAATDDGRSKSAMRADSLSDGMSGLRRTLKNRNALTANLRHKFRGDCKKALAPPYQWLRRSWCTPGAAVSEPETGTDALAPPARR